MKNVRTIIAAAALCLAAAAPASAAPDEDATVWRVQLRVRVCNSQNAGTNDRVFASLNGSNSTKLDYPHNDLQRNSDFTYDLLLDNVSRFQDITRLRINKGGSDGLCLRTLELRVNNSLIFSRNMNSLFLDNSGSRSRRVTISGADLRASTQWQTYVQPFPPFVITHAELVSRVSASVGTMIDGQAVHWGHLVGTSFVAVARTSDTAVHVNLDLEGEHTIPFVPLPAVDVGFDLEFSCSDGQLHVEASNSSVNVSFDGLFGGLFDFLFDVFGPQNLDASIADSLDNVEFGTDLGFCPNIQVNAAGDVVFSL
jgi:hypothetical protein